MVAPRIAFYGDDFTGSTDTLASLALAGQRTLLFLGVPTRAEITAAGPLDAIGLAGTSRAMSPAEMDAALPAAFRCLAESGAGILHYKCCSTFDSAPGIGSLGHAVAIARRVLGPCFVPVVGGQPNLGRYCVFGNLFASAGLGGPMHRIDRHPTMSRHPVTPMGEADLRRHLAAQGLKTVSSFDAPMLDAGVEAAAQRLEAMLAQAPDAVLFDVAGLQHLAPIGALIAGQAERGRVFALGPTGVEQTLLAHWRARGEARPSVEALTRRAVDRVFIVSGSLSPVTANQLRVAEEAGFAILPVDATSLADEGGRAAYAESLATRAAGHLRSGRSVIASTAAETGHANAGAQGGERFGRQLARGCGTLLERVLAQEKVARVGVAGGDTSSLSVEVLPISALSFGYALSDGAALCRAHAPGRALDGLEIMLKGGQMGPPDVFLRLRNGG